MRKSVVEHTSYRRNPEPAIPASHLTPQVSYPGEPDLAEWIRLPAPGKRCVRSGLTRGTYNDLIFSTPPKIKSVVVKKPGASRGIRLLYWPSVRTYLLGLMEAQTGEEDSDV